MVGAFRMNRELSSFLHQRSNLFTASMAAALVMVGAKAAYTSKDCVTCKTKSITSSNGRRRVKLIRSHPSQDVFILFSPVLQLERPRV